MSCDGTVVFQLENVLSKIRPRVDMLWIITCSDRMPSFFSRFDRYVRYKPLRPPEEEAQMVYRYNPLFLSPSKHYMGSQSGVPTCTTIREDSAPFLNTYSTRTTVQF